MSMLVNGFLRVSGLNGMRTQSALKFTTRCFSNAGASHHRPSAVKIVATIGPASEQMPMLQQVADAGLKIMRINFSHATYDEADLRTRNLRLCANPLVAANVSDKHADTNLRSIMLDTQGPEIRTGQFPNGAEAPVSIGDTVVVTVDDAFRHNQSAHKIWISYKDFPRSTHVNAAVLIEDGILELRVVKILSDTEVECRVMNNGTLGNKKGVNLPGQVITLPAISEKDKLDLIWGIKNDVDIIAASFIRKPEDVLELRSFIRDQMALLHPKKSQQHAPIIVSKIESTEGLKNFDEILKVSDGIMVARGDLGVEIPQESLLLVQKEIIQKANAVGKPVIVATQMLDSMQKNPRPTRAECTDVSNAVFDGADCVMLSGESAKGKYPVQSVHTMKRIVDEAVKYINGDEVDLLPGKSRLHIGKFQRSLGNQISTFGRRRWLPINSEREGVASSIADMAENMNVACIIVICETGKLAMSLSKFRPAAHVVCFAKSSKQARLLQIHYGLVPTISALQELPYEARVDAAVEQSKAMGLCSVGDRIIVVEGRRKSVMTGSGYGIHVVSVV